MLEFHPYPVPEPQTTPNEGLQLLDKATQMAQFYHQYQQQKLTNEVARQQHAAELAQKISEGGQDFVTNYGAILGGKMPMASGAAPTTSIAPTAQPAPQMSIPASRPADPFSQYQSIQDPYAPLPGMSPTASPALTSVAPPPSSGQTPEAPPPGPQKITDFTPEHLAQIRAQKGSKGLKEFEDQQNFILQQKTGQVDIAQKGVQNSGSLRDDYTKATLPFQTQSDNMQKIANIAKQPGTPASDMALMVAYMKVLDPGVTVREGQYARLEDTAAIPDKVRDIYNSLVEGKSLKSLTQTQRNQFLSAAANVYQGSQDRNKATSDVYTGIAKRQGLNPEDVVIPYGIPNFDANQYMHSAPTAQVEPQQSPVTSPVQPGMVRVQSPDGSFGSIPQANLAKALSRGYKAVR